ncbi:hypothetical protein AVEN_126956-1 [Araneus ventricosus]|uniref:Uncharacterized protein n=1 Tax=Araneus ventricosus TaxID=182803 RepID=A0A4Y2EDV7_ARAVE|nr:hypothetical protein AVEN_126956-1 [Araneus ventricosus]
MLREDKETGLALELFSTQISDLAEGDKHIGNFNDTSVSDVFIDNLYNSLRSEVFDPHKHSITGWQVTLPAFLLLVPELFEKMKLVLFSRFNRDALESYFSRVRRMTILLQWTYYILLHRTRMLLAELMFAMCGNANYEPDGDIILESTQIIPQTDEDC